jgi:hypothetical protein
MRFKSAMKDHDETEARAPRSKKHGAAIGAFGGKVARRYMLTDGPFTETKELVAGFYPARVSAKEEC